MLEDRQFEPVRTGLTRQQFLGGLADPLGAAAVYEHVVIQEELRRRGALQGNSQDGVDN